METKNAEGYPGVSSDITFPNGSKEENTVPPRIEVKNYGPVHHQESMSIQTVIGDLYV